jgi:hypothetical protein
MKRILVSLWPAAAVAVFFSGGLLTGCGEKITIPEPTGLFGGAGYSVIDSLQEANTVLQLANFSNTLVVLTPDSLIKRSQNFGLRESVGGLADPRALCVDDQGDFIFVYEQAAGQVSWYSGTDLQWLGSSPVPDVQDVNAMATNPDGIEQIPGARTYLYLSDPSLLVVHRYAFDELGGLYPHGILCRANGAAVRFVHRPAGLVMDMDGAMLVADADTNRNWIIRFSAEPDLTDVTPDPDDQDPLRGLAIVFPENSGVDPSPAADYVLGNAPGAGDTEWVGGPSDTGGEFHGPTGLAVDGSGRIFVADTENNRIQIFEGRGVYKTLFGKPATTPAPISLVTMDLRANSSTWNYAGYVYVALRDSDKIVKMISKEQLAVEITGGGPDGR